MVDEKLFIRRLSVTSCRLMTEEDAKKEDEYVQLDLFSDFEEEQKRKEELQERLSRERSLQKATLEIKKRYGKNAIVKGTSFRDEATARERNRQIGGHNAG